MKTTLPAIAISLAAWAACADDLSNTDAHDKTAYNLFQPTPDDLLRPITSSQYDDVIDAHTLDAGHLQVEASLINVYTVSSHGGLPGFSYHDTATEFLWEPSFRLGLLNNVDFEVDPTYYDSSERFGASFTSTFGTFAEHFTAHMSDFGNVTLGPKINLWGNDTGPTALALRPILSVPTDYGEMLAGLDIPFDWKLPYGFYLKLDTQFGLAGVASRDRYGMFYNAVSIHKSLCSRVNAYWYLSSTVNSVSGTPWSGYTGFGLVGNVTHDLQLFAGIGFGLNITADTYNPRFGLIYRL